MKKFTLIAVIIIGLLLPCIQLNAQVTTANNFGLATDYVGWNSGQTIPLNIMTQAQNSIKFYTNDLHRMIIDSINGYVGIGLNFMSPQNLLHLNWADTSHFYEQWTSAATGSGAGHGFLVGIAGWTYYANAELKQQEQNASIDFFTTDNATTRKMKIWDDGNDLARVGIGKVYYPLTHLHLGLDDWSQFLGPASWATISGTTRQTGWRPWMNIGTYMVDAPVGEYPNYGSDEMYVGLRYCGVDSTQAIINWGNNPVNDPGIDKGDRLIFLFTAHINNGQASNLNGLETARMTAYGNSTSRMGIGGDPTVNFYSTGAGDPQNTLEINSSVPNTMPPRITNTTTGYSINNYRGGTGFSGLRFTDLTAASTPDYKFGNPGLGILALDSNGDVIYVPAVGTDAANNGCSVLDEKVVLGNNIGDNSAHLYYDREIPMHDHDIVFTDPTDTTVLSGKNRIGIGMTESSLIIL